MDNLLALELAAVLLAIYGITQLLLSRKKNDQPLPPGPKGLPIVGNISDLPPPGIPEYQHWLEHKDRYGPLSSITVLGQTMIIMNDKQIALELLGKRANIHSGRPRMKFGFDVVGWVNIMASIQVSHTYRLYRKHAHQQLGTKAAVSKYTSSQEAAVGRFLWRLNRDQDSNLVSHLKTEAAELMLRMLYGYTIEPHGSDHLAGMVEQAMEQFSQAVVPGKWVVDIFPFLEHLPEWMPGTEF